MMQALTSNPSVLPLLTLNPMHSPINILFFAKLFCTQQADFDTQPDEAVAAARISLLGKKRSKVMELVSTPGFLFALTMSGVCAALNRRSGELVCYLNITPDEVIRSLFYNKSNNSLITVSVHKSDAFSSLRCRSTPIPYIARKQPHEGIPLFETESLSWPGFVEFDDVNSKVLTYSATDKVYKIWDLVNYTPLYSIHDEAVQEMKISPGIILLVYERTRGYVPLKILNIEDGTVLKSFTHLLGRSRRIDFIEQFNEKVLIKQEGLPLQIRDVHTSEIVEIPCSEFSTPSAFIFLYEYQLFLTFRNHEVFVWNFRGELVTTFEDHNLWHAECNTNNIYITQRQDTIISYCAPSAGTQAGGPNNNFHRDTGSINISDIFSGATLAKIDNPEKLHDVTSIHYAEDTNELYVGTRAGKIQVWSN